MSGGNSLFRGIQLQIARRRKLNIPVVVKVLISSIILIFDAASAVSHECKSFEDTENLTRVKGEKDTSRKKKRC